MAKTPRWLVPVSPLDRLIFSAPTLDVTEDTDYPGDPAPYLNVRLRAVPDRCACRREIPVAMFRAQLEDDEALALAQAIIQWHAHRKAQQADRTRQRKKVDVERARVRQLDAAAEKMRADDESQGYF